MKSEEIIQLLPYQKPFLFVDEILTIDDNGVTGTYTFLENESFYEGHFKNNPITPGVILTEVMAQIGVVCLGIYLLKDEISNENLPKIGLTSNQVDFYKPVYPREKVKVVSDKIYFRFGKLKCKVKLFNEKEELICRGEISGMIVLN